MRKGLPKKSIQEKHKHKWIAFTIFMLSMAMLCSCSSVNSPTNTVEEILSPTESPTPTVSPTDTPIPTPTPEPGIAINRKNFPDSGFRDYILDHFDTDYNELLSDEECQKVKTISLPQKGIESLEGIQYFPMLYELDCKENNIKNINLSENKVLQRISCQNNPELQKLQYSPSAPISYIDCSNTLLTELETCASLKELNCSNTRIKRLVFETGSLLEKLNCYQGSYRTLWVLDIAACSNLKTLTGYYGGSKLILNNPNLREINLQLSAQTKTLDVSGCGKLYKLILLYDYMSETGGQTVKATNLTSLYLVNICFDAGSYIGIPKSDLADSIDLSGCKNLEWVDCFGARKLNLSGCSKIKQLNYSDSTKVSGYKG